MTYYDLTQKNEIELLRNAIEELIMVLYGTKENLR